MAVQEMCNCKGGKPGETTPMSDLQTDVPDLYVWAMVGLVLDR